MLVLARQRDETIMIGDDIEVTVVDIRGDKVRLGINAPKEIGVHRKEIYDSIRRENRAASQVKPEDLAGLGKITPNPSRLRAPFDPTTDPMSMEKEPLIRMARFYNGLNDTLNAYRYLQALQTKFGVVEV